MHHPSMKDHSRAAAPPHARPHPSPPALTPAVLPPFSRARAAAPADQSVASLAEEDVMRLCGVHPYTAAADFFSSLRRRPPHMWAAPSPRHTSAGAEVKSTLQARLRKALAVPAQPLQVRGYDEESDADPPRTDLARKGPSLPSPGHVAVPAAPLSPSGLSVASRSGGSASSGAYAAPLRSDVSSPHTAPSPPASSLSADSTLRRDDLGTADRALVSQFDELRAQRRLLSVRPRPARERQEEEKEGSRDGGSVVGSDREAGDAASLRTSAAISPRVVQQTHVYRPSRLPSLSATTASTHRGLSGCETSGYDREREAAVAAALREYLEVAQPVVLLSLGYITPLHRPRRPPLPRPRPPAVDQLLLVSDSPEPVPDPAPAPPPSSRRGSRGGGVHEGAAVGRRSRDRGRTLDAVGGRLTGVDGAQRHRGGRLPPIRR